MAGTNKSRKGLLEAVKLRWYWYELWTGTQTLQLLGVCACLSVCLPVCMQTRGLTIKKKARSRPSVHRPIHSRSSPASPGTYMLTWWEEIIFSRSKWFAVRVFVRLNVWGMGTQEVLLYRSDQSLLVSPSPFRPIVNLTRGAPYRRAGGDHPLALHVLWICQGRTPRAHAAGRGQVSGRGNGARQR